MAGFHSGAPLAKSRTLMAGRICEPRTLAAAPRPASGNPIHCIRRRRGSLGAPGVLDLCHEAPLRTSLSGQGATSVVVIALATVLGAPGRRPKPNSMMQPRTGCARRPFLSMLLFNVGQRPHVAGRNLLRPDSCE